MMAIVALTIFFSKLSTAGIDQIIGCVIEDGGIRMLSENIDSDNWKVSANQNLLRGFLGRGAFQI